MEDKKNLNDSFNEVVICKPVPRRLCPSSKKSLKTSLSSSTSTLNSEINMNHMNTEETKVDLENISLEEINTDFFLYSQYLEEEECHNELFNIMNNISSDNENGEKNKNNSPKVKRCKNPIYENMEMMKSSNFDDLMNDLNELCLVQNEGP
jgi:hypothetical protein